MIDTSLIKQFEGLKLSAYLCPANKWTIGYGNTFYEDGTAVKKGDVITKDRAEKLLLIVVGQFVTQIRPLLKQQLNNNQMSALVSFTFNVGVGSLKRSTLLKKINANPNDATIRNEFMKWVKSNGQTLNGLVKRREAEANLYFKPIK